MYCPQCQAEYREGFTECADCRVPLLAGSPPEEPSHSENPDMNLVVILETSNPVQTAMARGLLEDSGIPFFMLGQITTLVTDVDPFINKGVRFQVPADREAEAREVLQAVLEPEPIPAEPGEDQTLE